MKWNKCVVSFLLALGMVKALAAATISMDAVDDYWNLPATWVGGVVPGTGDTAVVEGTGQRTIRINSAVTAEAGGLRLANASSGKTRTGNCFMEGGSLTLHDALHLANGMSVNKGNFNLSGGVFTTAIAYIGHIGIGTFNHSGGTADLGNKSCLGSGAGSTGYYNLSGSGTLQLPESFYIGNSGTGHFTQNGGAITGTGAISLGYSAGSEGHLTLNSGTIEASSINPGNNSTGFFKQTGGEVTLSSHVSYGNSGAGRGYGNMTGGSLTAKNYYIGTSGYACVTQHSGTVEATSKMSLGYKDHANSSGHYTLLGGILDIKSQYIGEARQGCLTQYGGSNLISYATYIGHLNGSQGSYTLHDGLSQTPWMIISGGTADQNEAAGSVIQYGGEMFVTGETRIGSYGSGSYMQNGGLLQVDGSLEIGMRSDAVGVYTQAAGNARLASILIGRESGACGSYVITGGSATCDMLRLAYSGGGKASFIVSGGALLATNMQLTSTSGGGSTHFQVIGTNSGITVVNKITLGANSTYEATLTPEGFSAPVCDDLTLSSTCSLKISAAGKLPYEMDNTEIPIMYCNSISNRSDFNPAHLDIQTGSEHGEIKSATVHYYPDRITVKLRVHRPPYATILSIF